MDVGDLNFSLQNEVESGMDGKLIDFWWILLLDFIITVNLNGLLFRIIFINPHKWAKKSCITIKTLTFELNLQPPTAAIK